VAEAAIAASVVYVASENLLLEDHRHRVLVTFGFGLVHGFGFASVLRELGLPPGALGASLLGFNAGVEVGQACIVLAVAPALALLRDRAPRLAPRVLAFASWAVVTAGGFWFVERVLGHA